MKIRFKYFIINNFVIWGGLNTQDPQYGDVLLKILLNAGTSSNLGVAYDLFWMLMPIINVKTAMTGRKPAGVRSIILQKPLRD